MTAYLCVQVWQFLLGSILIGLGGFTVGLWATIYHRTRHQAIIHFLLGVSAILIGVAILTMGPTAGGG